MIFDISVSIINSRSPKPLILLFQITHMGQVAAINASAKMMPDAILETAHASAPLRDGPASSVTIHAHQAHTE